ncbi:MAG TPA: dipeptidase [Thermomicrobiales bacterium]|nr:dipeptidase [Thermomicrobiales bacterium]
MNQTMSDHIHRDAIVIDATCPLLNTHSHLVDWWIEGGATAAAPTVGGFDDAGETLRNLARWNRLIEQDTRLRLIRSAADIEAVKQAGKFGIVYHFQGTAPIEDDLDLVAIYKQLGVGIIQLAYNVKNRVGDGCEERTDAGLSYFGVDLIARLNREKVIVDCSHTGNRTTLEAIDRSTAPVVFSHANVKALVPSMRTITNEQIKAVAATGGLVGAVGFPAFVSDDPQPTLDQFIDHIAYVADLVGIDHVALGIDYFAGQAGVADQATADRIYANAINSGHWKPESYPPPPYHYPQGIETPQTLQNLTARLLERGFSEDDTRKILGGNWMRVYRAVWGA